MFARHRDFLYKRSQNGAHFGLAARRGPNSPINVQDGTPSDSSIQSPDRELPFLPLLALFLTSRFIAKTSPAADPLTSNLLPQTTNTPATSPSAQTTPALNSPSPSSSSPSSASALVSASSQSPSAASSSRDSSSAHATLPSSASASLSVPVSSSPF